MKEGLIIKLISGDYTVLSDGKEYVCRARGVFRHQDIAPRVGDRVLFEPENLYIKEVKPRKNELLRPNISNVDKVFLVFSVVEPVLNLNLLDRLLSIVEYNDMEAIIIFTKLDILKDNTQYKNIRNYYEKTGYKVFESCKNTTISPELIAEINHSISVLAGQSGVGKSTILNKIDPSFNIKTAEISHALGRGKHTTRHVELLRVKDGLIADTPGFGISNFEKMELLTFSQTFIDFEALREGCRFSKCIHENEPSCAVKTAVSNGEILESRYKNYLLFLEEIKQLQTQYY